MRDTQEKLATPGNCGNLHLKCHPQLKPKEEGLVEPLLWLISSPRWAVSTVDCVGLEERTLEVTLFSLPRGVEQNTLGFILCLRH